MLGVEDAGFSYHPLGHCDKKLRRNLRTSVSTPISCSRNELNRGHIEIWDHWNARYSGFKTTAKRLDTRVFFLEVRTACSPRIGCHVRNHASDLATSEIHRKSPLVFPLEGRSMDVWTLARPSTSLSKNCSGPFWCCQEITQNVVTTRQKSKVRWDYGC